MIPFGLTALLLSIAVHGAVAFAFLHHEVGGALETGTGEDALRIERGLAIEGFSQAGKDEETVEATQTPPAVLSEARPKIDEVRAVEAPLQPPAPKTPADTEDVEIVRSKDGPPAELLAHEDRPEKPKQQPRPPQEAAPDQQAAIQEKRASGKETLGGTATLRSAYLGRLRSHLERKKVNPGSRLRGIVVVKFMLDPSGRVLSKRITASSGSQLLDNAALASLERASPFPPFPNGLTQEPIEISVPFRFVTR